MMIASHIGRRSAGSAGHGQREGGRIAHLPEIEPVGGRRGGAQAPVASCEHFRRPGGRRIALADPDEKPGDVAHHVVQEGVGRDLDREPVALQRVTVSRSMRRIGDFAWHPAARKALKSCSPSSAAAACAIRPASSGRWIHVARAPSRPEREARLKMR